MKCPKCKTRELKFEPHPTIKGRVKGYCTCNPLGPTYTGPEPKGMTKAEPANANPAKSEKEK